MCPFFGWSKEQKDGDMMVHTTWETEAKGWGVGGQSGYLVRLKEEEEEEGEEGEEGTNNGPSQHQLVALINYPVHATSSSVHTSPGVS
jgi:hypothetical protein